MIHRLTLTRIACLPHLWVGLLFAICASLNVRGESFTYSPVQSTARPYGLDIVDEVGLAGTDSASANFLENRLPAMQQLIDDNLGERAAIVPTSVEGLTALKPEKLTLAFDADVRAYFVGEGAGYHNTFGFNAEGPGIDSGNPKLIFPDSSSSNSYLGSGQGVRTQNEPLMPGDFVELGRYEAGSHLDFFLLANGANGGTNLYSTDERINPDGINHVVAFAEVANPYLLIGFEDLFGGGDKDYNDLLVALYIGKANVSALIGNATLHSVPSPEPGLLAVFSMLFTALLCCQRRRRPALNRSHSGFEFSP